jgi:Protein of unknown function (DUF2510)
MPDDAREAGWYPDRNDPAFNRYWNGRAWTARRHPVGATPPPVEHLRAAAAPATDAAHDAAQPRRRPPIWMWVIGALFMVRAALGVLAAFDHSASGSTSAVPTHPAAVAPSPGTSH